jgi:hypothetical protein
MNNMVAQTERSNVNFILNSVGACNFTPTVTASQMNDIHLMPSATSVSFADYIDINVVGLDSIGTDVAGDILGQTIKAKSDNIKGLYLYGANSVVANNNLRVGLAFPTAYSALGVPTYGMVAPAIVTLDNDGTYAGAGTTYVVAPRLNKNTIPQLWYIPLHYCSYNRAQTTVATANAIGDKVIELTAITNAVFNYNNLPYDNTNIKGEMMVIRATTGEEYRFMLKANTVGTTVSIVPGMYDAGEGLPIVFTAGCEVYFPLTPTNDYMLFMYGDAATSIITLYGSNTLNKYSDGACYTSVAGGWTGLAVTVGIDLFFMVQSVPNVWQLLDVTVNEVSSTTHLNGMGVGLAKREMAKHEAVSLSGLMSIPTNSVAYTVTMPKDSNVNSHAIFQRGQTLWMQYLSHASTTTNIELSFAYDRFSQNNWLMRDTTLNGK